MMIRAATRAARTFVLAEPDEVEVISGAPAELDKEVYLAVFFHVSHSLMRLRNPMQRQLPV